MEEYLFEMKTGLYLMEDRKSRERTRMSGEDGSFGYCLDPNEPFRRWRRWGRNRTCSDPLNWYFTGMVLYQHQITELDDTEARMSNKYSEPGLLQVQQLFMLSSVPGPLYLQSIKHTLDLIQFFRCQCHIPKVLQHPLLRRGTRDRYGALSADPGNRHLCNAYTFLPRNVFNRFNESEVILKNVWLKTGQHAPHVVLSKI